MKGKPAGSTLRSALVTLGVIALLLAFAVAMLPKGFSDDLSRIGRGANVDVLVFNKDAVQSSDLMTLLNQMRGDYSGKVEFLAVDVATDQGKAFVATQQVDSSVLLLFGPDGARRGILAGVRDERALRAALDNAFGLTPG